MNLDYCHRDLNRECATGIKCYSGNIREYFCCKDSFGVLPLIPHIEYESREKTQTEKDCLAWITLAEDFFMCRVLRRGLFFADDRVIFLRNCIIPDGKFFISFPDCYDKCIPN